MKYLQNICFQGRGNKYMNLQKFMLNDVFKRNAKVYQTKPVLATKYKPGMETGWLVYMCNKVTNELSASQHEGMKFFDTEQEALDYINADNKQYAEINGVVTEIPVVYDPPVPVLHRKETNPNNKVGFKDCFNGKYALKSNETDMYDFFILDYNHTTPDTWIIQDSDGNIRVWDEDYPESCNELFFGKEENYICERVSDDTYIEIAV